MAVPNKNNYISKEEFLDRLEKVYQQETWNDILYLVNQVKEIKTDQQIILNILDYINENEKISFKQWKVLRLFLKENNPDKKFKYGK